LNSCRACLQQPIDLAGIKMRNAHNHRQSVCASGGDHISRFLFGDLRVFQVADSKIQSSDSQNINHLATAKFYKRSHNGAGIQLLA